MLTYYAEFNFVFEQTSEKVISQMLLVLGACCQKELINSVFEA